MKDHPRTLPELLQRSINAHGGSTALIMHDERWTYDQLAEKIDQYARSLIAGGVGKGTRVGLLMENSPEWIALLFAATGLGAILVAVSTFSRREDLAYQLRHADVEQLFLSARFLNNDYATALAEIVPELATAEPGMIHSATLPALRRVVMKGDGPFGGGVESWQTFQAKARSVPEALVGALRDEVDPEDECYLLYTSGTTAAPKGVLHTHGGVARNGWMIGEYQMLDSDDVVWFYYPLFFSAGCINVSLGTLSHGAGLILQPSFVPGEALELIEREHATTWHIWPHQLKSMIEHPDWQARDHSHLHKGTGALDTMIDDGPDSVMGGVNMYGMTETCTAFTCTYANEPVDVRVKTNGQVMPGNEIKIVDPESDARVAAGETGEICVRGPSVLRRYYKVDPAETFDAEGFFHTGDLGWLDPQDRLHFTQRIKDMIKSGGINISPAEVESKLVKIPGVEVAYAFPMASEDRGEVVGAALVVKEGSELNDDAITAGFEETLAAYKRPRGVLIMHAHQVPMTGTGKVQKVVLRDRLITEMAARSVQIVRLA